MLSVPLKYSISDIGRIHEGQEQHNDIPYEFGPEEAILGQTLLGKGIVCQHSWFG